MANDNPRSDMVEQRIEQGSAYTCAAAWRGCGCDDEPARPARARAQAQGAAAPHNTNRDGDEAGGIHRSR